MENFLAIGKEELGPKVKKGDRVAKGDLSEVLEYGKDGKTGKESSLIGFVTVECVTYIVSIEDNLICGWEKCYD